MIGWTKLKALHRSRRSASEPSSSNTSVSTDSTKVSYINASETHGATFDDQYYNLSTSTPIAPFPKAIPRKPVPSQSSSSGAETHETDRSSRLRKLSALKLKSVRNSFARMRMSLRATLRPSKKMNVARLDATLSDEDLADMRQEHAWWLGTPSPTTVAFSHEDIAAFDIGTTNPSANPATHREAAQPPTLRTIRPEVRGNHRHPLAFLDHAKYEMVDTGVDWAPMDHEKLFAMAQRHVRMERETRLQIAADRALAKELEQQYKDEAQHERDELDFLDQMLRDSRWQDQQRARDARREERMNERRRLVQMNERQRLAQKDLQDFADMREEQEVLQRMNQDYEHYRRHDPEAWARGEWMQWEAAVIQRRVDERELERFEREEILGFAPEIEHLHYQRMRSKTQETTPTTAELAEAERTRTRLEAQEAATIKNELAAAEENHGQYVASVRAMMAAELAEQDQEREQCENGRVARIAETEAVRQEQGWYEGAEADRLLDMLAEIEEEEIRAEVEWIARRERRM